jgi:hypothetical protein
MAIEVRGLAPLLSVFDMASSLRFYCEGLGFRWPPISESCAEFRLGAAAAE